MKWKTDGLIDRNDKWKSSTGDSIGDSGARMLSESLKNNTTLTTLFLSGDEMKWIIIITNE